MTTASQAAETQVSDKEPDIFEVLSEAQTSTTTDLVPSKPTLLATTSTIPIPTRPKWMSEEDAEKIAHGAANFIETIRNTPEDITIGDRLENLGKASRQKMLPHVDLFKRKLSALMDSNKQGSPAATSLVELKQSLDLVNPAVIRSQPMYKRVLFGLLRVSRGLPKVGDVIKRIHENRETVESTITGLRRQLFAIAESLKGDRDDLVRVYRGLLEGEKLLERDIYAGHLLARELEAFVNTLPEGTGKENVKEALADLISRVNYLKREENANEQFFAGAQVMVKLIRGQVRNIEDVSGLLERSVMANLALAVSAVELETSVKTTDMLNEAIDSTLVDTAERIEGTSVTLAEQRSRGGANLAKLEKAITHIENAVQAQRKANDLIISRGGETFQRLDDLTKRVRETTEGGHAAIVGQ